jgi:lysozyme
MLEPYKDVGGKLTIGYGHLIRPGEYFTQVTEKEAEALLLKDVAVAEAVVKRNVKVRINAQQYSALVSLVYNVGQGHFEDSTLLELLNKGDYNGASKQFMRWVHVDGDRIKGLVTRRLAEKELFDS